MASLLRLVSLLQVLQQHAPGDAIHHQMVNYQQQPLSSISQLRQYCPKQRPLLKIKAALGFDRQVLQSLRIVDLAAPEYFAHGIAE
ncbi:hypothetical protein D3C79_746520 [compost metagenome]